MRTLDDAIRHFSSAITAERIISRKTQTVLRNILFTISILGLIGVVALAQVMPDTYELNVLGVALISFGLWVELLLLFSYHNSFYYENLQSILNSEGKAQSGATYDVAQTVKKYPDDVTLAFLTSSFGAVVVLRSGLSSDAVDTFLNSDRKKIPASEIILPEKDVFSLIGLGKYLLAHDSGFKQFLSSTGVQEKTFIGALRWVVGTYHEEKRAKRWWSKDNLSKVHGLGREWSYGATFLLERYTRPITTSAVFSTLSRDSSFAAEKVREIESILARGKTANVLVLGEPGVGKMDMIMEVEQRLRNGEALASINGYHVYVLDTSHIFASHSAKQDLEITLLRILSEARSAGNIILVIENISAVIREAEASDVLLPELLDEFLATDNLHVIATDTPGNFHTNLEPLGAFTRRFAEVLIDAPDLSATTRVLQSIALQTEVTQKVLFTYEALEAISVSADRYIVEGVLPDKAVDLLIHVASEAVQEDKPLITADFVYAAVSKKTHVPTGPVKEEERDLLLHLEDALHSQVIGQDAAIKAIARAMRRARAGIQSTEKPIGSFLFLGPTGVGKTETAKALASLFFGGEDKMQRLDMSEYSGGGALERLIGNSAVSGELPDRLREHPYCVLLLDEFEKADQSVHDLFLQILDEGLFTDGRGEKVNARNTIVIATSNAGSQLILKTVQQRQELTHLAQEIINHIINEGVFRPELLNRFDSTIIFEPLNEGEQTQVASLLLGGLYERIKVKGYELSVTDDLLRILAKKGYDPEFGARPMQRVLQDVIEEKIAQRIIAGSVSKGARIELSAADFTEEELSMT